MIQGKRIRETFKTEDAAKSEPSNFAPHMPMRAMLRSICRLTFDTKQLKLLGN
jgi:hypothetical protein